jgi:NitT/TauT family transport system substrate-binding protein
MALAGMATAQDRVALQISWFPVGDYVAFSAGIEQGIYRDAGIDLSLVSGRGSGDVIKKVAGGAAPFGEGDISALMVARVRENIPVKCFMSIYSEAPHAIAVLEGSGIRTLKDLAGKSIVTGIGQSQYLYFPLVAKAAGLDPNTVKWVTGESATHAPMLFSGRVDGATMFHTSEHYLNVEAAKVGKKVNILPYAQYGFKIYSICGLATEETLRNRADLVKRFRDATRKSYEWTRDNIDEAVRAHVKRNPEVPFDSAKGSIAVALRYAFPQGAPTSFGLFDKERLQETFNAVAQAQDLPRNLNIADFVDTGDAK